MATGARTFAGRELREVPEVENTLQRLGLGGMMSSEGAVGRNDNWLGTTTSGDRVFVKRLDLADGNGALRARRLVRFEEYAAEQTRGLEVPEFLGTDPQAGVFVYRVLDHAVAGSSLMVDEQFTPAHAAATGRALARLHAGTLKPVPVLDDPAGLLPSLDLLDGLPWGVFERSSAAQLQAWSLMQDDEELRHATTWLERATRAVEPTPAHCDLRVDQLLGMPEGGVAICDWEEFRLADPARDTGGFVGEWLYRAVLDVPTLRGESTPRLSPELDHNRVVQRGTEKLQRLRPIISAFWAAYVEEHPVPADLAVRTAAFAGWHLLDRMLAGAMNVARLQPIQRAAAGVGRKVLLDPASALPALGLAEFDSETAA